MSPLLESASSTSPLTMRPRSPWVASAGWRNSDGVPVEASVAEIFCPMRPLLPMPVTTTRPVQACSVSTARSKLSSRRAMSSRIASRLDLEDLAGGVAGHAPPSYPGSFGVISALDQGELSSRVLQGIPATRE